MCADCVNQITVKPTQKCPMCEKASLYGQVHARCKKVYGLDGLSVGLTYTGLTRRLLAKYKFSYVSDLADTLWDVWMSLVDLQLLQRKGPFLVTAVPLSKRGLRERGYNQAELLAKQLATYLEWEYCSLLKKHRHTPKQSSLPRDKRQLSVRGAFSLIDQSLIKGKDILVVDDIWTTGATMRECANVLKRAGAGSVWGAVLAG